MSTGTAIALVVLGVWLFVLMFSLALGVAAYQADRRDYAALLAARRHLRLVSRDEQAEKRASE